MSSEGSTATSTGSKIRQFGLYRSIDARTEEFLKLSRKRQLRQGCACAVISTLITVTVVVSVLLVYEYVIKSTWSPSNIKRSGWFGLINGTDPIAFEEKFAKSNTNFERTTLKLLPIVLKALQQNEYLEKNVDDYTISSPKNERKPATEFTFKRNVFSELKSMKPPSPRLYAIAYKSPPVTFTRNVTRNQDVYSKLRKMSDYKRIANYVDKMISEKVGPVYTQSSNYEDYHKPTEKNTIKYLKPPINHNKNRMIHKLNIHKANQTSQKHSKRLNQLNKKSELKTKIRSDYSNALFNKETAKKYKNMNMCTCLSKLGNLLNKLQANVQQLLSDASDQLLQLCNSSPKQENLPTSRPVIITSTSTSKASFEMTKNNTNKIIFKPNTPFLNHYIYNQPTGQKTVGILDKVLVDHSKPETDTTIEKNLWESSSTPSALKPNIQSIFSTTKSMPQVFTFLSMTHHKASRERKIYSSTTHKLDSTTTIQLKELKERSKKTMLRNFMTFPVVESEFKTSQHMNYWPLFKPNLNFKNIMKLNISKPTSPLVAENIYNITREYLKDDVKLLDTEHSTEASLQASVKLINAIDDKRSNESIVIRTQNTTPKTAEIIDTTTTIALEENTLSHTNIERTSKTTDITTLEAESSIPNLYNSLYYEDRVLEDDNYKITLDSDFYEDITPMPTSNVTKVTQSFEFEGDNAIQSMLPQNRPTYLKIQRSDWKHKDIFRLR